MATDQELRSKFAEMRDNNHLIDFKIIVEDTIFPAHKVLLAANSEYFKLAIINQMKESITSEVHIKDIEAITMEAILNFCYTGQIHLTDENIRDILLAASRFCIEPIKNLCIDYTKERINSSNCLGILDLSERCNLPKLHKIAFDYCIEKLASVVKEEEFLLLDEILMMKLVTSNEVNISETDLFQSLIRWTQEDEKERMAVFDRLVKYIRFTLIEPVDLVRFSNDDIVRQSEKCKALIDEAKNYLLLRNHPNYKNEIQTELILRPRDNLRRIYAIGGWADLYKALAKAEMFDPHKNEWRETLPMSEKRCGLGCAVLGDSIYAVGGHDGQNYLSSVERYDTAKETWFKDVPPMVNARTSIGVAVLNGCMYAIGGQMSDGATDKVERYDPGNNVWTPCASLNQKRLGAGVTVMDGYIYVAGGAEVNRTNVFNSVERYDARENVWSYVAPMSTARKHLGCISYLGQIYAIAGRRDGRELDTAEVYDPRTDSWSDIPNLHIKRHGLGVVELDGQIYAIGGQSDDVYLNVVESYDPQTMEWQWRKPMISDRLGGGVAVHPVRKY